MNSRWVAAALDEITMMMLELLFWFFLAVTITAVLALITLPIWLPWLLWHRIRYGSWY